MKDVSFISASMRGGGAERVQLTLGAEFARRGYSVDLVVFENDGPLRNAVPETVNTVCLNVHRVGRGILPLARYLKTEQPDVVIAAMPHVGTAAYFSKLISGWKGKLIIRIDGSRRRSLSKKPRYSRFFLFVMQRMVFPRAHGMVAVSNAIADEFRQDFNLRNCHVIHNPVDSPMPAADSGSESPHPFFSTKVPVIVAMGRLNRQKGFGFLLQAFAELRKTTDVRLIILGEGDERQNLENEMNELELSDHVAMPGFVNHPSDYLEHASAFALSSRSESFGLVVVEALSAGLPVVSTITEGPKDLLTSPALGELVEYGDVPEFAAALNRAIENRDKDCHTRKARAADFAPDIVGQRYIDLVEMRT